MISELQVSSGGLSVIPQFASRTPSAVPHARDARGSYSVEGLVVVGTGVPGTLHERPPTSQHRRDAHSRLVGHPGIITCVCSNTDDSKRYLKLIKLQKLIFQSVDWECKVSVIYFVSYAVFGALRWCKNL